MSIRDGGPAFPVTFQHEECTAEIPGMSLRDYFAAKAMQAGLTGAELPGIAEGSRDALHAVDVLANISYAVADAMIVARGGN